MGGFTTVEQTLIEVGEGESVYVMRRSFQQTMEEGFERVVEEATGRKVIAYMSAVHLDVVDDGPRHPHRPRGGGRGVPA